MSVRSKESSVKSGSKSGKKKCNVILPNNASLHYHHVVRGFGEGFGVKFDRDVHFIIRVNPDPTVKIEKKIFWCNNKIW